MAVSEEKRAQQEPNLESLVAKEVRRQLQMYGVQDLAERVAQADHVERKLHDAFSGMPRVKSVAYTRECDDWTLVITHDDEEKADAHTYLIRKLCDISRDDPLMPAFEPWILHVSETGGSAPVGEKLVVTR